MSITRWDPFRDLVSLREAMDRLFEESFVRPRRAWLTPLREGELAIDMYETEDDVVVKTAVPGVSPDDIDISIVGDTLSIKGETKTEEEVKEGSYLRRERHYGAFSRTVSLPAGIKADKAEASYENGILTLTIPKAEEVKPKTIKVKTTKK
ncbi:MAG: Hsp20/alpha crystallin family protein [Anaerolineae bacterium]